MNSNLWISVVLVSCLLVGCNTKNDFNEIDPDSITEFHVEFTGPPPNGLEGEHPPQRLVGAIPPKHIPEVLSFLRDAEFDPTPAKCKVGGTRRHLDNDGRWK